MFKRNGQKKKISPPKFTSSKLKIQNYGPGKESSAQGEGTQNTSRMNSGERE